MKGSKFKPGNPRGRNFTQAKMQRPLAQIDESIARYLSQIDSADRQGEAIPEAKITRLNEKIATLREEIQRLKATIDPAKIKQMKADGMGPSTIAKALRIGRASVYRALRS